MSAKFCTQCAAPLTEEMKFCPQCAAKVNAEADVCDLDDVYTAPSEPVAPTAPAASSYAVPPPVYVASPYAPAPVYVVQKPPVPGRGFGIASMVLGIVGLYDSFVLLIMSFMMSSVALPRMDSDEAAILAVALMVYFVIFSVFPILALSFAAASRKRGYYHGISTSGLAMGLISLAFVVIALAIMTFSVL